MKTKDLRRARRDAVKGEFNSPLANGCRLPEIDSCKLCGLRHPRRRCCTGPIRVHTARLDAAHAQMRATQ